MHLLPTNKQVLAVNEKQLAKLNGEEVTFGVLLDTPKLAGKWTPSLVLSVKPGFSIPKAAKKAAEWMRVAVSSIEAKHVSILKKDDGYVMRVKLPPTLGGDDFKSVLQHHQKLVDGIEEVIGNCSVVDVIPDGLGLQSPEIEAYLETEIKKHPVAQPLTLKVGARVLLRANLNNRYVNGSIGFVGEVRTDFRSTNSQLRSANSLRKS